ncbi:MAG: DUF4126 domain-containing protein [Solirubrobacterales bacterium]
MELIPTVISAGYAAGLNAYGTVALLGLLGRAGFGEVPEPLESDGIIIGAAVMYAIEFVTDKVPLLDNAWDVLHTLVRPAIGSALGVEFAELDQVTGAEEALAGGGAGATALVSHGIKAGVRLGINASPEPVSNILASLAEDGIVAAVIALTLKEPLIALAVVIVLLAIGIGLLMLLRGAIRRALAKRRERKGALVEEDEPRGPPP